MARAGRPGTIRGEAAARGVTEYQVRVERGRAAGLTPSVAVGKPRRGELTLTQRRYGYVLAGRRNRQTTRYRIWWARPDGSTAATEDTNVEPHEYLGLRPDRDPQTGKPVGTVIGYEPEDNPFVTEEEYPVPLHVAAVTVRNRRRR